MKNLCTKEIIILFGHASSHEDDGYQMKNLIRIAVEFKCSNVNMAVRSYTNRFF